MSREFKKRKRSTSSKQCIPRPANAFIIFRSDRLKNTVPESTPEGPARQEQKYVSRDAAGAWKNIDPILRRLYEIQANIIKEEHAKKYPGWVYRPKFTKRRSGTNMVVEGGGPYTKRIACSPRQTSYANARGEGVISTHSPRDARPMELVWDSSWFSRTTSMMDPFYYAPLRPLTPASPVPSQMASTHPRFSSVTQIHDLGATSDVHALSSVHGSEPPTQWLRKISDPTLDELFEDLRDPDSGPFRTMGS